MSDTVIKVENLSKLYRLGVVGTGTLTHDINRWWHKVRGKEDPYSKIGETNVRESSGESEYVWALKDINFEVKQGEVLGIIGKNGAGKSTLLKLLSKVTGPTEGRILAKGRIASLLEVGTGFHPELTGRENIYLNGTILGMTRREVDRKLEEIIEFAGVARYVDTPVKRYSSGMKVRLGFAVAAHLEPEILIVDEVLAVGDAEFQKKAIGKMQEVSHEGGRTVLFVSHNMASVKSLCDSAMVLEDGRITFADGTDNAVNYYLKKFSGGDVSNKRKFEETEFETNECISLKEFSACAKSKTIHAPIIQTDSIEFKVSFLKKANAQLGIVFRFKDENGNYLFVSSQTDETHVDKTDIVVQHKMTIPSHFFNEGHFYVDLLITKGKSRVFLEDDAIMFTVLQEAKPLGKWMGKTKGPLKPKFEWHNETHETV